MCCVLALLLVGSTASAQFHVEDREDSLSEVVVTSSQTPQRRLEELQTGVERVDVSTVAGLPTLVGERDVVRGLELLPGVKSEGEGMGGFQVRGGTSAQNLILLDGAPVYNASHAMGLFSSFNADALQTASLYKGLMPAHLGGGLSGLLELGSRHGDPERHHFSYSIGLLSAKAAVDGPIGQDGSTYQAAVRRSYLEPFIKANRKYASNSVGFYDVNANADLWFSEHDRLTVSVFRSHDLIDVEDLLKLAWNNTALGLTWLHRATDNRLVRTQLVASEFLNKTGVEVYHLYYGMKGYIRPFTLRHQQIWTPNSHHSVNLGAESTLLQLQSAQWNILSLDEREQRNAWTSSVWMGDNIEILPQRLQLSAGLRLDLFSALGGRPYYHIDGEGNITDTLHFSNTYLVKTYTSLQPRMSLRWKIGQNQVVRAGYSRTMQSIQALRNSSMALPFDRYTMASNIVRPQLADQMAVGWATAIREGRYDFTAEAYWKDMHHVYDYRDGKSFQSAVEIERLLLGGRGRAYGLELCARKNSGLLTGWAAYTLSWVENKIPGINDGDWYTAPNDRRHDLLCVAICQLSTAWQMTATWRYTSGQAMTPPYAKYQMDGEIYYYYHRRNESRAPAFHRLDLGLTHTHQLSKWQRVWAFGLYNAYYHYNPFIVHFEEGSNGLGHTRAVVTTLFGIIPSVSLSLKRI